MNLLAATSENDESIDQVYNVALNDRTSLNELYKMIESRLIHLNSNLKRSDPIYRDFRIGDVRHSQASINKAKELLGYKPEFKISKGLDYAMEWYSKNL
jgi:UDP-N-acetylglucosamine 4-epimerase